MAKFRYDGVEYETATKFTVGEIRKMETKVHGFNEDKDVNTLLAVIWISRLRVDKTARFEDFDDLTKQELEELIEEIEEEESEDDADPPADPPEAV